jgi:hypothetical protein
MVEAVVTHASAVSAVNPYAAYSAGNKYPIALSFRVEGSGLRF